LNLIKSPAHPQGIEEQLHAHCDLRKKLRRGFFDGYALLSGDQQFRSIQSRNATGLGPKWHQDTQDFRAKGQMIWELHCRLVGLAGHQHNQLIFSRLKKVL
jgi:hypothetical protein